ncbi:NAF1-domain-containing protein [Calocera viscosa TUFC12733]|uniref:H/ACA ribonucleoprotein complex non-core subunit NAF1 n=1 Tax=Calocera viscosa (strain TUFC12733) TaxID=1330018 RepID=A0A167M7T8_CALVF|nr:NAF1-domain-containing protein [Calocera viscosa TUFC12733]
MDSTVPAAPHGVPQDLAMLMEMVQEDIPAAPRAPVALPVKLPINVLGVAEPVRVQTGPAEEGELSDHEVADILEAPVEVQVMDTVKTEVQLSPPEVKSESASEEDSDSDDDDSDSDADADSDEEDKEETEQSEEEIQRPGRNKARKPVDLDDVDEEGGAPADPATFASKNEIFAPDVNIPDFDEIGPDDKIENIGEVMNIVDSVVVVKGRMNAQYQVIDTGSLLVFEDRKVLGYVFETFGAVTQPLYSVRFPSSSSIDKERITISRAVFHVPDRSNYVFTRHLLLLKGSDASNMHDEEVSDGSIEFSDDEKEAEYKRMKKIKRRRGDTFQPDRNRRPDDQDPEVGLDYGDSVSMEVDPRAARGPPVRYDDEDFGMGEGESIMDHAEGEAIIEVVEVEIGDNPLGTEDIPGAEEGEEEEEEVRPITIVHTSSEDRHPTLLEKKAIARVTGQYGDPPGPSQPQYQDQRHPQTTSQDTYDPRAPSMTLPITPSQPYPPMQFPMGGYINPRFAFAQGFFPQMNPAMLYGMQQGAAMPPQGGYAWPGQQQRPPQQQGTYPPQQPEGYPPQDGRAYDDGGGQYRH